MAKPAAVATYAGADAALYGMGDTGEVDPLTVGIAAATGGTLSKGIQLYGKGKANRTLGALQNEMNIIAAQSDKINSGPALLTQAKKNLGLSDSAVDKAIANSKGKKLNLPTKSSAIEALEASSAQEVVKSGSKTALGKGLDYIIEPISEGIKRISPRTYGKLKQVERTLFEDSHNYATMIVT